MSILLCFYLAGVILFYANVWILLCKEVKQKTARTTNMEEKPTKPQKLCVSFNNSLPLHHLIITRSSPEKFKLTKVRWREEGTDVQLCP